MIEHLRFEQMLSGISARFVNIPAAAVDQEIERALKQVLGFFQVDRCGLLGISPDRKLVHVTHAAYGEGIEQVPGDLNLAALFPWVYNKLVVQGTHVSTTRVKELPPAADTDRQTYAAMGVRSSLDIPLSFREAFTHIVTIQALREERSWPEEYIPRLRLLGEIFLNALERGKTDRALRESEARLSLATDAAGVMPWDLDAGSGRIWTTEKAREFFGFAPDSDMTLESFLGIVHSEDRERLRRTVEVTMQSGRENSVEYRVVLPDGSTRWVLSRGRPFAASSEGRTRLMGVSADITERKRVEVALVESERRLRDITFSMADWVWEVDEKGVYTYSSAKGLELFGHVVGKTPFDFMPPEEAKRVAKTFSEIAAKKEPIKDLENWNIRMDGERICLLTNAVPMLDEEGNLKGYRGVDKDITGRKLTHRALLASEERFRALAESALVGIYVLQDGRYAYVNPAMARVFGYSAAEMTGMSPRVIVQSCDYGMVSENIRRRITGEVQTIQYGVRGRHRDGSTRDVEVYGTRIEINGSPALVGTLIDITERKRAEAALEESRAQIAAVMNSTRDFIWSVDPERFGLVTWNRAFRDYFFEQRGIELEVGMTPPALVPPDYVPLWNGLFSRALREEFVITEYVVVAQTRTLLLSLHAMRRDQGAFGISVFGRDITELKRAEAELLTEKNKLQSIMSAMNTGITIRNLEYELIYQNDYSLNTFGNHLGEKCYRVFAGRDGICDDCPVEKAFKDGKPHSHVKEVEKLSGGITFWENTAVPMRDSDGNIYACLEINNNITERKKSEKALIDSEAALRNSQKDLQKLAGRLISAQEEELRRLSRELHDDLTQRLAVLAIEAGKLELDLNKIPGSCQETLQKISRIKDQLIEVSEDVHNISRQLHPTILDDLGLVRAIESECAALMWRENVEIIFSEEDVPAEIGRDIALCLYRVLQEGLKNVITHSLATRCEIFLKGADNAICLTVSDNGVGFEPAEVRLKSGLGLSSMRERAQLVLGVFSIKSRPGQGTVIRIETPLKAGGE